MKTRVSTTTDRPSDQEAKLISYGEQQLVTHAAGEASMTS